MLVVVSHPSTLTAYLLAYTLSINTPEARLQVLVYIVERSSQFNDKHAPPSSAPTPWCGVQATGAFSPQITRLIHALVAHSLIIPVGDVQLTGQGMSNPNFASRPLLNVNNLRAVPGSSGYIYHPPTLENQLRVLLASSGRVFFTSRLPETSMESLYREIEQLHRPQRTVVTEFLDENRGMGHLEMRGDVFGHLISTGICANEHNHTNASFWSDVATPLPHPFPLCNLNFFALPHQKTILWIPYFRTLHHLWVPRTSQPKFTRRLRPPLGPPPAPPAAPRLHLHIPIKLALDLPHLDLLASLSHAEAALSALATSKL